MADYTAILTQATSISSAASTQYKVVGVVASAVPTNGRFGVFTASLGVSVSIPSVIIPSTQTKGQLFP